jgi:hypothetical protein
MFGVFEDRVLDEVELPNKLLQAEEPSREDLYDVRIFDPCRYFLNEE